MKEYEGGESGYRQKEKYGITGATTIKDWVKKYGREGYGSEVVMIQGVEDQQEYKGMKERIRQLEKALAEEVLERRMLETVVAVASEKLELDLKKSFGQK